MYPRILSLIVILISLSTVANSQIADYDNVCRVIRSEDEDKFEQWLSAKIIQKRALTDEVYQIPVVVHVLNVGEAVGEGYNISDERILSQIRVMNEDFRRKEGTRGFNTNPAGDDAKIEFVLAKSTPDGHATNGIVRVNVHSKEPAPFGGSLIAIGAYYSIWNPNDYFNIWAFPGLPRDLLLGQSRFPISDLPGLDADTTFIIPGIDTLNGVPVSQIDGIAINTLNFGETGSDSSKYNLGRTGTHETGHFLGLFHIWGAKGSGGSCGMDDYCDDTPPTDGQTSGCPLNRIACDGRRAMIENYMDYTDDECMNIFTKDQIKRMRTVLENSPRRKSLLTSKGLNYPTNIPLLTSDDVKVYPNPARDLIFIEFPQSYSGKVALNFYDLSGKLINSTQHYHNDKTTVTAAIPKQSSNMLILKIVTDSNIIVKKIMIVKD